MASTPRPKAGDFGCMTCGMFVQIARDKFSMDFQAPMSALQAFAICLTSFDSKLACE